MAYDLIATFKASPNPAGWTIPAGVETAIDFVLNIVRPGVRNGWNFSVSVSGVSPALVRTENMLRDRVGGLGTDFPLALAGAQTLRAFVRLGAGSYTVTGGGTYSFSEASGGTATYPIQLFPVARITVTGIPPNDDGGGAGGQANGLKLNWLQARFLALEGAKIRREGWRDRYLEYTGSLWWLQMINPLTNVATTRAVVQAGDWAVEHFRAADWTCDAPDAAVLAAARMITTVFP